MLYCLTFQEIGFDYMNILFATGGTGGHITVALSLGKEIRCKKDKVSIKFSLNSNATFEQKIKNCEFDYLTYALKIPNCFFTIGWFSFIIDCIKAFVKSFRFIAEFKPDILIGFGSYASVPMVLAGFLSFKRIKIILHEQNVVPGKANRLLSAIADKVAVSFKTSESFFKTKAIYTGNFVDKRFFTVTKDEGIEALKLNKNKFIIIVMGGSQGATAINKLFMKAIMIIDNSIKQNIQVIHICGLKNYEDIKNKYKSLGIIDYQIIGFSDMMPLVLAAGDLVISRAGATSIAEINALGKPAILIPYPYAGNHQRFNAQVLGDNKAAIILNEKLISEQILADTIIALINDTNLLKNMAQASRKLANPESINKMKHLIMQSYKNAR